jgi:hypothetical protein
LQCDLLNGFRHHLALPLIATQNQQLDTSHLVAMPVEDHVRLSIQPEPADGSGGDEIRPVAEIVIPTELAASEEAGCDSGSAPITTAAGRPEDVGTIEDDVHVETLPTLLALTGDVDAAETHSCAEPCLDIVQKESPPVVTETTSATDRDAGTPVAQDEATVLSEEGVRSQILGELASGADETGNEHAVREAASDKHSACVAVTLAVVVETAPGLPVIVAAEAADRTATDMAVSVTAAPALSVSPALADLNSLDIPSRAIAMPESELPKPARLYEAPTRTSRRRLGARLPIGVAAAACLTLSVGIGIADRLVDWRLSEVVRLTYQDVLGSLSLHPERASSSSRLGRISAVSVDTLR